MHSKIVSTFRGTPPLSSPPAPVWTGVQRGSVDYRRISLALFLSGFSTFSLLYCVQPLLPVLTGEFHIGAAQSSLALSLSTGLLAFSILCAGPLSERVGRRGLMFGSLMLAALCNLLVSFAPSWHLILIGRALEGFVLGGVPAVAMAYLAEEIDPRGLGMSMGLYVGGTAFGGMMGRVGMSVLTDWFSWRTAMASLGVIDLIAAVAFVMLLPPSRNFTSKVGLGPPHHLALWRRHLAHPMLPMVFGIGCLVMGAFVTIYNYAGFRLIAPPFNLNSAESGLIFSAYLFGVVASSVAGGMADRYGRGPVLVTGIVLTIVGVLLTLSQALAMMIAGIVALTIGFFIAHSVASGWVGRLAVGAKGHASSLYLLAYYLGSSFLGSVGGHFWERGAWPGVATFALVLLAGCLLLGLWMWRRTTAMSA
ncbi:MFS transporter [Robbsia andropogonis]|uniref:MFS transporter n=1 Tax=Robbsia andropogonis TaxID=28092 RepID=A0A0F5JW09_9BURK|nr:MFS transporter [Robbsia andropogonis]KKB62013.1 MFS transporter [Robbsia andropogonis]